MTAVSTRMPRDASSLWSWDSPGLGVVSSLAPVNRLLAPAKKARACISSLMAVRPALSRMRLFGKRIRAVAIMRMNSMGGGGSIPARGVPATGTSWLMGMLSGGGSRRVSSCRKWMRSSVFSPMPTMPPVQTSRPASRTARMVSSRSSNFRVEMMVS